MATLIKTAEADLESAAMFYDAGKLDSALINLQLAAVQALISIAQSLDALASCTNFDNQIKVWKAERE